MNNYLQIVIADDDQETKRLMEIAFQEAHVTNPLMFVASGLELLDFLSQPYHLNAAPGIILLDLDMPRMNGHETLKLLKKNEEWKKIPVIIFSNSDSEKDIEQSYLLGASSYMVKPGSFDQLVSSLRSIKTYWFDLSHLPGTI